MARFSDALLNELKRTVPLVPLVEAFGVPLKRHGADRIGLCPFHNDREPSLVISPKKNLWHCLGACQTGGSVIDWVMKAEGISFRSAVEILQTRYAPPTLAADPNGPAKESPSPKQPTTLLTHGDDSHLLAQVIDHYQQALKASPEAMAYLEARGIANQPAIETFKLGYANRTLTTRLPTKSRKEGAALRGQLQRLGVLRPSGHELFHGSLVMPIVNDRGQVVEVYGRKIQDHQRKGVPLHLYLPGPHLGVWNHQGLGSSSEVILCEALIDALSFWCAGFHNVTASYGVSGFTDDHLTLFKAHRIKRVLIAYDADQAGNQAAIRLAARLHEAGIVSERVGLPALKDANSVYQVTGVEGLERALRQRTALPIDTSVDVPAAATAATSEPVTAATSPPRLPASNSAHNGTPPSTSTQRTSPPLAATTPAINEPSVKTSPPIDHSSPTLSTPPSDPTAKPSPLTRNAQGDLLAQFGQRHYRVRGFAHNTSHNQIKVNLRVHSDDALHVDTLDLYAAKHRTQFIQQAAVELGVPAELIKRDLAQLLLALEQRLDQQIEQQLAPSSTAEKLTDDARRQALAYLRAPNLLDRLLTDLERCGMIGEAVNKQVAYLACLSRKLERPLAILVQSASAAGKSSLMDAMLALVPEDERLQYSAMTGQSLYYLNGRDLKHKILAIVEEQGASEASYALKLLQSEGELTIASTGKDPQTGQLITQEYRIEGPIMLFSTTTAVQLDEELVNRCLVLGVDESREQTQAIHAQQRRGRTLEGLLAKQDKARLLSLHRAIQRLLRPLAVINPYAEQLSFLDDRTRLRRDHEKYLTLIDAVALLHQHQRPVKTLTHNGQTLNYIEVIPADVSIANRLAHEVLGRTLDELAPQTRRLLEQIHHYVIDTSHAENLDKAFVRFSRRQIREYTGWSDFQIKTHLRKLTQLEYVLAHQGGRGQRFIYELLYNGEGQQGQAFLMGLTDSASLADCDANREHQKTNWEPTKSSLEPSAGDLEGSRSPQSAAKEPAGSGTKKHENNRQNSTLDNQAQSAVKTAPSGAKKQQRNVAQSVSSHDRHPNHSAVASPTTGI